MPYHQSAYYVNQRRSSNVTDKVGQIAQNAPRSDNISSVPSSVQDIQTALIIFNKATVISCNPVAIIVQTSLYTPQ